MHLHTRLGGGNGDRITSGTRCCVLSERKLRRRDVAPLVELIFTMRAAEISRLAQRQAKARSVPIAQIGNEPQRHARARVDRRHRAVCMLRKRRRRELRGGWTKALQWMRKTNFRHPAPGPLFLIRTELSREVVDR